MLRLNKNTTISILIIFFIFITSIIINILYKSTDTIIENKKEMLLNEAKALFNSMVMTRFWNASHNGIFIKKQPGIEPNPYLPNSTMTSDKGETYIKINPAWMTRQISIISNKKGNYYFNITSLKPLNPNNKPDLFETEGLKYFEKHEGSKYFYRFSDNLYKFDFIGRLNTEKSCLQCHGSQNYKLDDTRGGIRVSIPTEYVAKNVKILKQERLSFSIILILIIFIILVIFIYFINKIFYQHKKLKAINSTLEKKVKDEVEKNIKKEIKLNSQSKLVAMGEMVGNIAHQWRQPLSIISVGATGLKMQHELGVLDSNNLDETLDIINESAQYLSQTIDDFRNFIRGDKEAIYFSLEKYTKSFLKLVDSNIKKYDIKIVSKIDGDFELFGYPNQLVQCFINIFNNSKDAFLENNISAEKKIFFITEYKTTDKIIIEFKDNAKGIPEDIINKIFEPYFTTKEDSKGTGLGLHMTLDLITRGMNGIIEVSNEEFIYENKKYTGAKFKIILPNNYKNKIS